MSNEKGNKAKPLAWEYDGDCIRCTSHKPDSRGYPRLKRGGIRKTIARLILFRRSGIQPGDVVSRHTCDREWCINPEHIIIGSQGDNNRDRAARGRNRDQRGEKNNLTKLTADAIRSIRSAIGPQGEIAKLFGISQSQVSRIKNKQNWAHV